MAQPPAPQSDYDEFLAAIKERVRVARLRAVAAANQELLRGYWEIGSEILRRQQQEGWGAKVIDRLAADLRTAFPGVKGFSRTSLHYMREFAAAWPDGPFVQASLGQISWYHHLALLDKLDDSQLRAWYGTRAADTQHLRVRGMRTLPLRPRLSAPWRTRTIHPGDQSAQAQAAHSQHSPGSRARSDTRPARRPTAPSSAEPVPQHTDSDAAPSPPQSSRRTRKPPGTSASGHRHEWAHTNHGDRLEQRRRAVGQVRAVSQRTEDELNTLRRLPPIRANGYGLGNKGSLNHNPDRRPDVQFQGYSATTAGSRNPKSAARSVAVSDDPVELQAQSAQNQLSPLDRSRLLQCRSSSRLVLPRPTARPSRMGPRDPRVAQ